MAEMKKRTFRVGDRWDWAQEKIRGLVAQGYVAPGGEELTMSTAVRQELTRLAGESDAETIARLGLERA